MFKVLQGRLVGMIDRLHDRPTQEVTGFRHVFMQDKNFFPELRQKRHRFLRDQVNVAADRPTHCLDRADHCHRGIGRAADHAINRRVAVQMRAHRRFVRRLAVVSDDRLLTALPALARHVVVDEARRFASDQKSAALTWLAEPS